MRVDPVRELIERILAASAREGGFTESIALEVERSFRHDYNGETCYIKERTDDTITSKKTAVVAAYLQNQPVEQITQHHGISRATLYRYLKRQ
jgi:transcriptional regulator of acetoin/glycerol metabolism